MRHFVPLTEPLTPSHICWHIPAYHTYGHRYPKYITFSVKSSKFYIFHYWGFVNPHVWRASWPLAPRLVVTLQSLITPNHISNILVDVILRLGLNSCDAGPICLQFWQMIRNVSMSSNDYVIWTLHIDENLYIDFSSMPSFSNWECHMYSVNLYDSRWLDLPHIRPLFDQNVDKNYQ